MRSIHSAVLGLAVLVGGPSLALAHHHGFHVDVDVPGPVIVETPAQRVWVPPVCRTVVSREWVEAVVQNVDQQVWVPDITQRQETTVYVPDQFAWQDVVTRDRWDHRRVYRQQVLVCPAHTECRAIDVVVSPGHYVTQCRPQVVTPAHWQDITRQEIVCQGHWEQTVPALVEARPRVRVEIPLPF